MCKHFNSEPNWYQNYSTTNTNNVKPILTISDPPSVSVHKLYLSQHNSLTLELVCSVQSNPSSAPRWTRLNGNRGATNISTDSTERTLVVERRIGSDRLSVVVIHSPQDQHLGEYACSASNSLGEDHQIIHLKGNITVIIFLQLQCVEKNTFFQDLVFCRVFIFGGGSGWKPKF